MKKVAISIYDYLKDWKNLLFHAVTGIIILIVAIYLPVPVWVRIGILVLVVFFNIFRTKLKKGNKKSK